MGGFHCKPQLGSVFTVILLYLRSFTLPGPFATSWPLIVYVERIDLPSVGDVDHSQTQWNNISIVLQCIRWKHTGSITLLAVCCCICFSILPEFCCKGVSWARWELVLCACCLAFLEAGTCSSGTLPVWAALSHLQSSSCAGCRQILRHFGPYTAGFTQDWDNCSDFTACVHCQRKDSAQWSNRSVVQLCPRTASSTEAVHPQVPGKYCCSTRGSSGAGWIMGQHS